MLVASAILFVYQLFSLRQGFDRDLASTAEMVANSSVAAISFHDRDAANEVLRVLRVKPQIVSSRLELPDGAVFAEYGEPLDAEQRGRFSAQNKSVFDGNVLYYSYRITLSGQQLATCLLRADYGRIYRGLLTAYLGILAGVLVIATILAWLLSYRLQQHITSPILQLARTSKLIAEKRDYSVRALRTNNDELGQLTDAFNQMLSEIQDQDAALKESREHYQLAVSGTDDGLWDWDLQKQKAYFSPRWKAMLGYDETELTESIAEFEQRLHPEDRERVLRAAKDHIDGRLPVFSLEFRMRQKSGDWVWIHSRASVQRDAEGLPYRMAGAHSDITARKESDVELARLNQKLHETSRQAGMAEVAIGVLHNVGNVLNSVNVSAGLVMQRLQDSRLRNLSKIAEMLRSQGAAVGTYLTVDPKGKMIPSYLGTLSEHLVEDHTAQLQELQLLTKNVDHIKQIVAMQQNYAKVAGLLEPAQPSDLVEDALRIAEGAYLRHRIEIVREFQSVPDLMADRHKTLQILVNLLNNAKQALDSSRVDGKRVVVRIFTDAPNQVKISVSDNGCGIPVENLARIFQHGFTTKKEGHGFGLHSGANAAREMGGRLLVHSDGPASGATFTLELPIAHSADLKRAA